MKMLIKTPGMLHLLLLSGLSLLAARAGAQSTATPKAAPRAITYILPDGSTLGPGGLDSLNKAWGQGRVSLMHSSDDDEKGIMHVQRVTDEQVKQMAEAATKREQQLKAMIGTPAADFTLTDLSGKRWSLSALKGKVIVLNFWFTSCPPCIQEMPELNQLVKKYDPSKVVFLALTFDADKKVKAFLQTHTFDYNLLPSSTKVDNSYHISAWPTSIVVDKQGVVTLAENSSPAIGQELSAAIDKAM